MSKKKNTALAPKKAAQLARDWQRCRQEALPGLFYAYDDYEEQSERVVSYRLPATALKALLADAETDRPCRLVVHLGLRRRFVTEQIPKKPAFALMLQVRDEDTDLHENCYLLRWRKNSRFSDSQASDATSNINAIPAAGAYLFIYSWLQMPEEDLAAPFTAVTKVLGRRVQRYVFSEAESASILQDLRDSPDPELDIHLGSGLAVWQHPFSFRPVVEVKQAGVKNNRKLARNATGLLNDDGDSFYDFSRPIPPPQND